LKEILMKMTATFSSLVIASAIVIAGCNAPPTDEVNAAKVAGDEATSAKAPAPDAASRDARAKGGKNVRKPSPSAAQARAARTATAAARSGDAAETVTPPEKIKHVQPVYPSLAQAARVEGSVLLSVAVDEHGKVTNAKVLRGVPLLDRAALEAVMQWEYSPMRRGDVAVPGTVAVTVNFTRS
jgi:TonB family protein